MDFDLNKEESLEIMEFQLDKNVYGINIAKVKEVVKYSEVIPSPDQNPCVEGILMLRGSAIPIINLAKKLALPEPANLERTLFIITSFNELTVGIHVHVINGIKKLSWGDINKPDPTLQRHGNSIITGIVNKDNKLTVLLDFEKLVADINPVTSIKLSDVKENIATEYSAKPILIVDDSLMLISLIEKALTKAGFTNIIVKQNGREAYDYIAEFSDKSKICYYISLIVTDIEMPEMDGLSLCRKLKRENFIKEIPLILFSSIINNMDNDYMVKRCKEAGAEAYVPKPEVADLIDTIISLLK